MNVVNAHDFQLIFGLQLLAVWVWAVAYFYLFKCGLIA
ncbi:hypothetical protein AO381_1209 [Moraxella catarrhalis]|nr:hypothetical protein AO381_1209 [Moraxella catarrhalis]